MNDSRPQCARMVTCSKFHVEDALVLGTTVQNSVAQTTWWPEFVHPWFMGTHYYKFRFVMFLVSFIRFLVRERDEYKIEVHLKLPYYFISRV
jgi:hypothetical protein